MNNKKIQSALEDALEQEIPSREIRLWPAIESKLVAGNDPIIRQGENMKTTNKHRIGVIAAIALVFVALVLAVSPQGRAFAQDVLQFFTRTESDTFYQEPSDMTFEEMTAFHAECGISIHPTCSVEQVRSKVDYEVKEPAILPDGMYFEGATGSPDWIELAYLRTDPDRLGGEMSIIVEATGRPSAIGTGIVAKSAPVEQVQIGDLPGEYYTGTLFQDEDGNVTWNPNDPTATLRWEDGGSTYTLYYYSMRHPLTKEDLIRVAESMTLEQVAK